MAPPPENAYLLIFFLIWSGVSLTKMADSSMLALILPVSPCSAGKKRDSINAGFSCFSFGAASLVQQTEQ